MQLENELTFITKGIYEPFPHYNFIYHIEDFNPVIINNKPKIIGEGRFSTVYLYKHKINESLFALKKISMKKIIESGNDLSIIQREINIHSRIHHENIVKFFSYNQGINEVNILLEYCPNGSIFELISKNGFDEFQTYKYFSQVVNAVYFLHKNNLVHRDIKPENILLHGDVIKLCDFGWCCETNANNRKSFCGTFEYMAPEIIQEMSYGKPVDIWALGILLYELYFGVSPFNSNKVNEEQTKEIIDNIMQKKLFFNRKNISYDMKDLIIHMLENDVNRRYTIDEVVSHPWFKKCKNKIKNIDLINSNHNNIFDNFETNVTKVTKIIKIPSEKWSTKFNVLHKNRTFNEKGNNYYNFRNINQNNYFSNKTLNFNNIKKINNNTYAHNFNNNDEEDGFSPFMKNGSINFSVSLNNNYNFNRNNLGERIHVERINSSNIYYSSNKKNFNPKTQIYTHPINKINLFPMDNTTEKVVRGKINHIKNPSNQINSNRISIVKLKNEVIDSNMKKNNTKVIRENQNLLNNNNINNHNNIINYNFYQINNNNQFNNIFY